MVRIWAYLVLVCGISIILHAMEGNEDSDDEMDMAMFLAYPIILPNGFYHEGTWITLPPVHYWQFDFPFTGVESARESELEVALEGEEG